MSIKTSRRSTPPERRGAPPRTALAGYCGSSLGGLRVSAPQHGGEESCEASSIRQFPLVFPPDVNFLHQGTLWTQDRQVTPILLGCVRLRTRLHAGLLTHARKRLFIRRGLCVSEQATVCVSPATLQAGGREAGLRGTGRADLASESGCCNLSTRLTLSVCWSLLWS